jgi:hypothetical protein
LFCGFDFAGTLDPGAVGGEVNCMLVGVVGKKVRSMVLSKSLTTWLKVPRLVPTVTTFLFRVSRISGAKSLYSLEMVSRHDCSV